MNLTTNFTLHEFTDSHNAVRACLDNTPPADTLANLKRLAFLLEDVRLALSSKPVKIGSGYRSLKVNRLAGSSDTSQHVKGLAADFSCRSFGTPKQICQHLLDVGLKFDQLIQEGTWVHISLADQDAQLRNQVLTAVFYPGRRKTKYLVGLI